MGDQLHPSIAYLQKLGPEYLDIIFQFSQWIFERDTDMAFEVRNFSFVLSHTDTMPRFSCRKMLNFLIKPLLATLRT